MSADHAAEILRLRSTVRDLLALSAIPDVWVGREPPAIAAEIADLLIEALQLDFAFVRLCDSTGCHAVEAMRGDSWEAFPEWLQQRLPVFSQVSRKEIVTKVGGGEGSCCGIVIPIGVNGERGLLAAACDRSDFPNQIDQQLLSVAANNAAVAFQNACLINELRSVHKALRDHEQELRKSHDELELKVAERTSELQRSEAYLAEAQRLSQTGSWAWNPETGAIRYWSEECYRVLGFDPAGPVPSFEEYFQRIHLNDRAECRERFDKGIRDKANFEFEHRIVHPDKWSETFTF